MKINEINEGSNPLFKINKFLDDKKKREEYARKLQQQRDAEDKEKVSEDFGSIPPLTDLIVMAVVGQTTVAALKAAYKTGKYALKLKRLADKAGVKLNNAVMGEQGVAESNPFTDARMNAIKAGKKEFTVNGKKYRVTGDTSDEEEAIANEGILDDIKTRYRMKSRIKDFELDREDNDKFGLQRPAQDRAERRLRKKLGKSVPSRLNPDQTQNENINEASLKVGSRGEDVAALQRALGIPADGIFGPATLAAVKAAQERLGVAADGIVGPKTMAAMQAAQQAERNPTATRVEPLSPIKVTHLNPDNTDSRIPVTNLVNPDRATDELIHTANQAIKQAAADEWWGKADRNDMSPDRKSFIDTDDYNNWRRAQISTAQVSDNPDRQFYQSTARDLGPNDDMSFGQAFKAARSAAGGGDGQFTWRGKQYQTNLANEPYIPVSRQRVVNSEAVNRDEYAATLAAKQQDKFFAAALAALDRLVKSDPRGQDVGGYAFDIARAFNGVNGKELAAAYSATNESNLLELDIKTSKNHVKAAEYKNYSIYINKQKNNLGMFITIVMNGKNDIPALRAQAKKQEDAIAATKDKIDSIEEKAEKITSNATINLNVNFIREELPAATHYDTTDTFYAKLDVGPSLVIASEDWGDEATQLGFKKVAIKTTKSLEGTSTGGVFGMASGAVQSLNLIKHGRYTIGNMYRDDEGNYIFPLEYHSTAAAPNDPLKLGKPALGVNPRRE